jgi:hypothetical protein
LDNQLKFNHKCGKTEREMKLKENVKMH